jgi:pentatricopeptide repeat protein
VTNKLLTSKDLLNSSWAIYQIGEQYYNKAIQLENDGLESQARDRFTKAMTIWERLIVEMPQSDVTPYAYNSAADCYGKLGQHEKAIEYYRKIVDNWPRYQYAWNAQFMIGHTYEELNETGVISKSEVDPKIKAAYEQLLERYPGCIAAEIARYWLSHNK